MRNEPRRFPLFTSLSGDEIDRLIGHLPRQKVAKGQTFIRQGGKNPKAYFLVEGRVGVFAESSGGLKSTLMVHEAPNLFGELEVMQNRPYLGSVVAIDPSTVIVMTRGEFLNLLNSNHQVALNFAQMVTRTLYDTAYGWRMRIFGCVEHLVAGTLCSFAQMYGEEHEYGILVRKEINKSELAEILGVARKSIIRALTLLTEEKLIQLDGKQLVIPDIAALRAKANSPLPLSIV